MFIIFNNEEVIGKKSGFPRMIGFGGKARSQNVEELMGAKKKSEHMGAQLT